MAQRRKKPRGVPITREMRDVLERQRRRFIDKFGREPGENDPVFFDPAAEELRPINDEVVDQLFLEAMHRAQVDPAIIYAYQKTGRIVTRENRRFLSREDLAEWRGAIAEWRHLHGGGRTGSADG